MKSSLQKSKQNLELIWIAILVIITVGVRLPGLQSRSIWYDESITILETAGQAHPEWPSSIEQFDELKNLLSGSPSLPKLFRDLKETDIHPPIYYWSLSLWRRVFGASLETARLFSLIFSLGSILLLYRLLKIGNHPSPLIPAIGVALASGSVFLGHEARAYALAQFFIATSALFAYLFAESEQSSQRNLFGFLMSLFGALAFQTNYLALFPVGAILLWFLIVNWSESKTHALGFPLLAGVGCLIWYDLFRIQIGARPHQNVGFIGFNAEFTKIIDLTKQTIWTTNNPNDGWLYLILITSLFVGLFFYWDQINKRLFSMFLGLAFSPLVGLFLLDALFNKNLPQARYLLFAIPGIIVFLTYGIVQNQWSRYLLILFFGLQIGVINWGQEKTPSWSGSNNRSLTASIKAESSESTLVAVGAGFSRGFPGEIIYEIDGYLHGLILNEEEDIDVLKTAVPDFEDVWILLPNEAITRDLENAAIDIVTAADYFLVSQTETAVHFQRTPSTASQIASQSPSTNENESSEAIINIDLWDLEGSTPHPLVDSQTFVFVPLEARFTTPTGLGWRHELKIKKDLRAAMTDTYEEFQATIKVEMSDGGKTIVSQFHVGNLGTIVKLYVSDSSENRLIDGEPANGIFDVYVRFRNTSGDEESFAFGTIESGDSFTLQVVNDYGLVRVEAFGEAVELQVVDDSESFLKFGSYLQSQNPIGSENCGERGNSSSIAQCYEDLGIIEATVTMTDVTYTRMTR